MKQLFIIAYLLILIIGNTQGKSYYVSTTGNDGNTGLSITSPWKTLSFAASLQSPVVPGDVVYIKAGDYGAENVAFKKSGMPGKPITFTGYKFSPGDSPNLNYKYGDSLNSAIMPLFNGKNRNIGIGLNLHSREYLIVKNIQITNYESGLYAWGTNYLIIQNIIVMKTGDVNLSYSGKGIIIGSSAHYNKIQRCIVVNACAEGITINGNYNIVENSKVFCDEDITAYSAADYYLTIIGSYNTINSCNVERIGNLSHKGHGISIKYQGIQNAIDHCTAINTGFFARFRGVKNNSFTNCETKGKDGGFCVRDGASYNTFSNCRADSCESALSFFDTSEDEGAQYCGRNNIFKNCVISNATYALHFKKYDQVSPVDSNYFINCTFYKAAYLVRADRPNNENQMINCIVTDMQNIKTGLVSLNMTYTYTNFFNNGFATPSGDQNTFSDPIFSNKTKGDFHLKPGSSCINSGTAVSGVTEDYSGNPRPQGETFDRGAYEYIPAGTPSNRQAKTSNTNLKMGSSETYNGLVNFIMYPNPANKLVTISTINHLINKIELVDENNRTLKMINASTKKITIDLTDIPPGMYFIKANFGQEVISKKIIIN